MRRSAEVRSGAVTLELIDAVSDHGLLVVGSAAHRALAGKFIGNISERVLHHLKAAMLVVY
jgi:nucleotide-binding universal stress UspA family protein